jgi:hypothetical protein
MKLTASRLRPIVVLSFGLAACLLGLFLGAELRESRRGPFAIPPSALAETEEVLARQDAIEREMAETIWELGSPAAVRHMLERQLAVVPEQDAERRLVVLLRAALISDNPEGQSAILSSACSVKERLCAEPGAMKERVQAEAERRRIPPGNTLPIIFLGAEHSPPENP